MKKIIWAISLVLLTASVASAQAVPTSKIAWTQTGPDLATVQAYTYKYYADNLSTGVAFGPSTVICSTATPPATPFSCVVNIPTFTQGNHTLTITASNAGGESPKSAPLSFTFTAAPPVPTALRLIP